MSKRHSFLFLFFFFSSLYIQFCALHPVWTVSKLLPPSGNRVILSGFFYSHNTQQTESHLFVPPHFCVIGMWWQHLLRKRFKAADHSSAGPGWVRQGQGRPLVGSAVSSSHGRWCPGQAGVYKTETSGGSLTPLFTSLGVFEDHLYFVSVLLTHFTCQLCNAKRRI